jgi:hypothetical protein
MNTQYENETRKVRYSFNFLWNFSVFMKWRELLHPDFDSSMGTCKHRIVDSETHARTCPYRATKMARGAVKCDGDKATASTVFFLFFFLSFFFTRATTRRISDRKLHDGSHVCVLLLVYSQR